MTKKPMQYWTVWYPQAAATGVLIARGLIDPTGTILFHAAAPSITVEVSDQDGMRLAFGQNLIRTQDTPICRLTIEGRGIRREDIWPAEADLGRVVLLPGGEAGALLNWWNAPDHQEWRWQIEFYNSRRE